MKITRKELVKDYNNVSKKRYTLNGKKYSLKEIKELIRVK